MSVRIDLARKTITVSPGTLLAPGSRRVGSERGDFERLWIGQAVHRRVLEEAVEAIAGYRSEQTVRASFPLGDFTATLEGRVDGRWEDGDRVVIDEVKSLHFVEDLPRLPGSPRLERFLLQLRWYLLAVSVSEGRDVTGRLILADIESGATRLTPVNADLASVREDLLARIQVLLDSFLEDQALAEAKATESETLAFPFPRWRPGQKEMAAAVDRAVRQGDHLLVEAPTGIGKTAAALWPMLRAALRDGRKLFVLTSKTTQQEIFRKTLDRIEGESFRSMRLRAKERMCANDVVLCHEEHCAHAKDYGAKLEASGLVERLLSGQRHLDPDRIFEEARREVACPFEVSLELADLTDLVIGDYNYVFDPVVALRVARDPGSLAGCLLLVDEAHNLVDRARAAWSPSLSEEDLRSIEDRLGVSSRKTALEAAEAISEIRALLERETEPALEEESRVALVSPDGPRLDDLRLALESLLVKHLASLRDGGERVPEDPVVELFFAFSRFHDVVRIAHPGGRLDPAFDVLASRTGAGPRLAVLCKDPSRLVGPIVNGAACTVAMSATLSPFEFYRDLLGLDPERTSTLRLPSPFPKENRAVVVSADVDTRYGSRSADAPKLGRLVADVAESCPGNVLALFPSYRFLDEVRATIPPLRGRRVLRPSDRSTELERNAALAALADGGPPVLLLAASGGAFAEGVDYPGEMLKAVIVISPALPAASFEQERMKAYFEERMEKGFDYAYVVPGMTRVIQSAGRLIRSESDTGVIVLACQRFLKHPYRRYLPADWYEVSPDELARGSAAAVTRDFFERVRRGEIPKEATS